MRHTLLDIVTFGLEILLFLFIGLPFLMMILMIVLHVIGDCITKLTSKN